MATVIKQGVHRMADSFKNLLDTDTNAEHVTRPCDAMHPSTQDLR